MSKMSDWAQTNYGIGLSAYSVARSIAADELDAELVAVMTAIETGMPFDRRTRTS
jgi:hypothetical protein